MKALVCEMCGSKDLVKQDGMYVCKFCGTQYTTEEAKKLMVEVSGSVEIDNSKKLENLYVLARRAKGEGNSEDAAKYSACIKLGNCIDTICNLLEQDGDDDENIKRKTIIAANIHIDCMKYIGMILRNIIEHAKNYSVASNAEEFMVKHLKGIVFLCIKLGDFDKYFGQKQTNSKETERLLGDLIDGALYSYKTAYKYNLRLSDQSTQTAIIQRIQSLDPSFQVSYSSTQTTSSGCYVATCVYGSYDCPQVWTLRRYRDNTLAKTWYGRAFIKIYYAISPTLVKWFGNTHWFKKIWKPRLDNMVNKLHNNGVSDQPYQDKEW